MKFLAGSGIVNVNSVAEKTFTCISFSGYHLANPVRGRITN